MARKPSRVFEMPDLAEDGQILSCREIEFFVSAGFLIKPRLLARKAVERVLDRAWAHLLEHVPMDTDARTLTRGDPTTWPYPVWGRLKKPAAAGP